MAGLDEFMMNETSGSPMWVSLHPPGCVKCLVISSYLSPELGSGNGSCNLDEVTTGGRKSLSDGRRS